MLTKSQLVDGLRLLGVNEGSVLEVHASLSSFGYVHGGAQTVVDALITAVGYDGTIVMPAQSSDNSEPSRWQHPPIEPDLYKQLREQHPSFDMRSSTFDHMGEIANNLRLRQGTMISNHPTCAFMAYGKQAKWITQNQPIHFPLSMNSPLGKLLDLRADILMLGVDYDRCTALHLAECQTGVRPIQITGSAVDSDHGRQWKKYLDYDYDSDEFIAIGKRLEEYSLVRKFKIQSAECKLFNFPEALSVAIGYFKEKML
ncbi:MAG: AAC(3) family N-acetyltransferase [Erysipelotrichales bacterium]|nr:MAG: AAC(3) family N-acetyltransferase [Erysipelotrichales bacterium]